MKRATLAVILAMAAYAQPRPEFEVVSIKPGAQLITARASAQL
jgi:hypothetical protein